VIKGAKQFGSSDTPCLKLLGGEDDIGVSCICRFVLYRSEKNKMAD